MPRAVLVIATVLLATAGVTNSAFAKGGAGGKQCKPGMTFNDCYERCVGRAGLSRKDMQKCSNKCSRRGCE